LVCEFFEFAVAEVAIQAVGLLFAADEQVEPAIVVVVGPLGGDRVNRAKQPCFLRDVREFRLAVYRLPSSSKDDRRGCSQ
jgi:hypothetical protein